MKRTALLLLLAIAVPAFADRFNVTLEGKPVSRAQVCASRAGELASPMTRFFTGTATLCYSADAEVKLPPGRWNVFARRGTELISDSVVLATGGGSKTYDLPLVAAAAVEHDDQPLYVYLPATGSVIPVSDIVPAERVVPLIVKAGRVLCIGTAVTPRAGKTIRFDFPEEKGSVIVPVTLEGKAEAPQVMVAGMSQRADASLLFFRVVPAGLQSIELAGERWKSEHAMVKVDAGAIAVSQPIVARLRTTLRVRWSIRSELPKNTDCEGKSKDATPLELVLFDCNAHCTPLTRQTIAANATQGVVEFPGIGAGSYQLGAGPLRKSITVADGGADVDFEIRYVTFFGRVTRGGKPLHVRLFGTATDDTGDYAAALTELPKSGAPVELTPCEGGGVIKVIPDQPPADKARFDVEVPDNRLTVHVVDAESHAPVEKAFVTMAALENGHDQAAHFAGPTGMTDAEGRLVIDSAVANRRLHICAWRSDYENGCSDRFELGGDKEKTVELALSRSSARQGRVILPTPQQVASVAWYTPDGHMTEIAQVREDGSFIYQRAHGPGEIVTYVSVNEPLIVTRQPPVADGDVLEIRPAYGARVRTFQVALSSAAKEGAMLAIALGDIVVPADALRLHMARHGMQPAVMPGWTTTVPDVVESGPIRVMLLPMSFLTTYGVRGVDIAMTPEASTLPQQVLGERGRIEFP